MVKFRQSPLDAYFLRDIIYHPVPASKIKRLINVLLDYFGAILFLTFFFFILILLGADNWVPQRYSSSTTTRQLVGAFAIFSYYIFMEYFFGGKTLGKYFTRTKVVMQDGTALHFKAIFWRAATRFIPFDPFSLLFERSKAWHDTLSGTMVIEDQ